MCRSCVESELIVEFKCCKQKSRKRKKNVVYSCRGRCCSRAGQPQWTTSLYIFLSAFNLNGNSMFLFLLSLFNTVRYKSFWIGLMHLDEIENWWVHTILQFDLVVMGLAENSFRHIATEWMYIPIHTLHTVHNQCHVVLVPCYAMPCYAVAQSAWIDDHGKPFERAVTMVPMML